MFGPTFYDELKAAGLTGLPFTWGDDGSVYYGAEITSGQKAQIEAVIRAHDPTMAKTSDTEAKRAMIQSATTIAGLKSALLDVLELK